MSKGNIPETVPLNSLSPDEFAALAKECKKASTSLRLLAMHRDTTTDRRSAVVDLCTANIEDQRQKLAAAQAHLADCKRAKSTLKELIDRHPGHAKLYVQRSQKALEAAAAAEALESKARAMRKTASANLDQHMAYAVLALEGVAAAEGEAEVAGKAKAKGKGKDSSGGGEGEESKGSDDSGDDGEDDEVHSDDDEATVRRKKRRKRKREAKLREVWNPALRQYVALPSQGSGMDGWRDR